MYIFLLQAVKFDENLSVKFCKFKTKTAEREKWIEILIKQERKAS